MRPITKGDWPTDPHTGASLNFKNWKKAIQILKIRTGEYCHLCEMKVTNPIAIEHIKHKEAYPRLQGSWINFLLSCNYCNSRKGQNLLLNPYRRHYFWPHLHNTLLKFEYGLDGLTHPHRALNPQDQARAQRTIDLYKLDAANTSTGDVDQRHRLRLAALRIAIDRKIEFEKGICTVSAIVDSAVLSGFFAVWYTVFQHTIAVRDALIDSPAFCLAGTGCFNALHEPMDR